MSTASQREHSDRPKVGGCASEIKISTVPQRERSDRAKVPRGLGERSQISHRATKLSERPKVTRGLPERSPGNRFVRDFRQKRKMKELLCCRRVTKFAVPPGDHLEWTSGLNYYGKNPPVWPHCLGKIRDKVYIILYCIPLLYKMWVKHKTFLFILIRCLKPG